MPGLVPGMLPRPKIVRIHSSLSRDGLEAYVLLLVAR